MFKQFHTEDEIFHSMEKSLIKNQTEKTYGLNKLSKVMDYLNEAAALFEQAGMIKEATQIIEVMQDLSKDLK